MSDPATGTVRSLDRGNNWEKIWDVFGAIDYDPWNSHSMYMGTRGGIWWVHPKNVQRKELPYENKALDGPKKIIPFNNTIFANFSNATYKLTEDIKLKGKVHDLVMMPRGLKNVIIDGQGHTVTTTISNAIFGDDTENVTIQNFHFVQPVAGERNPVIYLANSRNLIIRNCVFEVTSDFETGRYGAGPAIETRGIFTKNVTIENCIFKTSGRSPVVYGNGSHIIRNCTFAGDRATNVLLVEAEGSVIEENNKVSEGTVRVSFIK
jgi:polygalacturonase